MLRRLLWFFVGVAIGGLVVVAADAYALGPTPPGMTAADIKVSAPSGMPRIAFGPAGDVFIGNGSVPGSAVANRQIGAYIGSRSFGVDLSRYTPPSALARAGRIAMRATGVGAAVALGLEVLDLIFDEETGQWTVPEESEYEPGAGTWRYNHGGVFFLGTIDYVKSQLDAHAVSLGYVPAGDWYRSGGPNFGELNWVRRYMDPGCPQWNGCSNIFFPSIVKTSWDCPPDYIDAGGVCLDSNPPRRPATDQDLETAIENDTVTRNRGGELLDALRQLGYWPDFEPLVVSGPSSVIGETTTTTTTSPAGTTTSTKTRTYNLDYSGDTVTVTPTITTTITTPDGETITETETQTPAPGPGIPAEEPLPSLCEQFPDISACQDLGEAEEFDLPEEERDLDWEKEMSAAGSCPAPIPLTIRGNTYTFSYEPACIGANYLRPIIIGLAWLTAGIFLFSTVRQS